MKRPGFIQHHFFSRLLFRLQNRAKQKSGAGFTLTEMLVYIGIVGIVLVVFMNFMIDVSHATSRSRVAKEVSQNGRTVIDRIVQDVRTATSITVVSANSLRVTGTSVNEYTLSSGRITVNGSGHELTSPSVNVTGLSFTAAGNGVTINLVLEGRAGTPADQQKHLTLTSTVEPHKLLY